MLDVFFIVNNDLDRIYNTYIMMTLSILAIWPFIYWISLPTILMKSERNKTFFFKMFLTLGLLLIFTITTLIMMQYSNSNHSVDSSVSRPLNILGIFSFLLFIGLLVNSGRALKEYTSKSSNPASVIGTVICLFYLPIGMFFIKKKLSNV